LWLDRLTPKEERSFDLMCLQYSSTNHVFHVRGIVWPPEPTPTRFRAWSAWLKGGVGMEDRTLAYDVIEFPPHHDLRLNIPERMFNLPPPDPPAKVPGARAVPVIQPPAVPAR
jgi:hypothetical protein